MTTQTVSTPTATTAGSAAATTRIGAGVSIAGIAVLMAGFALLAPAGAVHTNPVDEIAAFYSDGDQTAKYAGGLIESVGLLMFLPFVAMMVARLRGADPAVDLVAPTAQMAGAAYVVLSLAPGQAAGAAALWLGARGADPSTLMALNTLRAFSYYLALLSLSAFLVCVGIAGIRSGRLAPWMSWSAVVIGAGLAAGVAVAHTGLADIALMVALAWVVAVSVGLLRRPETVPSADRR
jgi:hypothetical protein